MKIGAVHYITNESYFGWSMRIMVGRHKENKSLIYESGIGKTTYVNPYGVRKNTLKVLRSIRKLSLIGRVVYKGDMVIGGRDIPYKQRNSHKYKSILQLLVDVTH